MLWKCCTQYSSKFGKLSSSHRTGKGQFSKKGNVKECSNYHTIALISHASEVMLKLFQLRLQQYMNHELPLFLIYWLGQSLWLCRITTNWKILKEMGIPDNLTCLLRNLHAGQEATVRTGHGTIDCFQTGKGVRQGCILSPCLFNLYAE